MSTPPSYSGASLGVLVRQVRDAMRARWAYELTHVVGQDLSFSHYLTIKKLADGVATVGELARVAELSPSAMTRVLDRLEAQKLVTRVPDPVDRRVFNIRLTAAGRQIARDIAQCSERLLEVAFGDMDPDQRAQFIAMLEQVRDNLAIPES